MSEQDSEQESAVRLAELASELHALEETRVALIARLKTLRESVDLSGEQTGAIRADLDSLIERFSEEHADVAALTELEDRIAEMQEATASANQDASVMAFEIDSLKEALSETDDEIARLSAVLLDRRSKLHRGH